VRGSGIVVIVLALALAACGSAEQSVSATSPTPSVASLPATVEGMLVVDVAEGDVDDEGTSEFNFGTLTVGDDDLMVEVGGSLLQSAGVPEAGAKVRATLGSKTEQYGATTYRITALSRL
jgi:hypothetical protein